MCVWFRRGEKDVRVQYTWWVSSLPVDPAAGDPTNPVAGTARDKWCSTGAAICQELP